MNKFYVLVIIILCCATAVMSSEGDGGYAGAFLRMGMGARAAALGDAYSAIPEDATAGFYNPALLPHLQGRHLIASHSFLTLDRNLDFIGFATSLSPKSKNSDKRNPLKAGMSLGWVHAGVDNIYGTDGSGNHTIDYSNSEHVFYMGFAVSPAPRFSFGLRFSILYNRMPDMERNNDALTSSGFGTDLGAYYTPVKNLMIGVVFRDLTSKYNWNTAGVYERGTTTLDKFPKITRAAVAYRIPQEWLLLTAESETSNVQNPRYHFGVEAAKKGIGALRMGLDDTHLAFGGGLDLNIKGYYTVVNYAFVQNGDAPGSDHIFSWSFVF